MNLIGVIASQPDLRTYNKDGSTKSIVSLNFGSAVLFFDSSILADILASIESGQVVTYYELLVSLSTSAPSSLLDVSGCKFVAVGQSDNVSERQRLLLAATHLKRDVLYNVGDAVILPLSLSWNSYGNGSFRLEPASLGRIFYRRFSETAVVKKGA